MVVHELLRVFLEQSDRTVSAALGVQLLVEEAELPLEQAVLETSGTSSLLLFLLRLILLLLLSRLLMLVLLSILLLWSLMLLLDLLALFGRGVAPQISLWFFAVFSRFGLHQTIKIKCLI